MRAVAICWLALATAAQAASPICRDAIARAIETRFNIAKVPMGTVRVPVEDARRIGELAELREKGAVTWVEIPRKKGDEPGERTFVVTPTKAALRWRDDDVSTSDAIGIRMRRCEIVRISSDEPAGAASRPSVEEKRLVTGVYRLTPTAAGEELFGCGVSDDLRFRALVELNEAANRCEVVAVDWGRTDRTDWETSNVE